MALPISCKECRRRKIKCDKVQPCSHCTKKNIKCSFPSKFRSLDINQVTETLDNDKNMTLKLMRYEAKIKELETKLAISEDLVSIFDTSPTTNSCDDDSIYVGANSISKLEVAIMSEVIKNENQELANSKLKTGLTSQKKSLPVLIPDDPIFNHKLITELVEEFFTPFQFSYFKDLLSKEEIITFIKDYESITDWEHDDQLMLLIVILIDVLKKYTRNNIFVGQNPISKQRSNFIRILNGLSNYYFKIVKFQPRESINLIKSQLILLNYYYYAYDGAKAWKMLCHIISNSYSQGLHITQGPLWLKINEVEAVLCSGSSRPNLLSNELMRFDDDLSKNEFGVVEFITLLRLKNKIHVEAYVKRKEINYKDIMELSLKFDSLVAKLELRRQQLSEILLVDHENPEIKPELEKIQYHLIMTLSIHLNIHHEFFETRQESDSKTMELLERFTNVVSDITGLKDIRNKSSILECLMYQIFLIFLKYLNFKSIQTLFLPTTILQNGNYMENSERELIKSKLISLQDQIKTLFKKNPDYSNRRILRVVEIIVSLNINELSTNNIINETATTAPSTTSTSTTSTTQTPTELNKPSPSTNSTTSTIDSELPLDLTVDISNFYTNEEMREFLHHGSTFMNGLKDITGLLQPSELQYLSSTVDDLDGMGNF